MGWVNFAVIGAVLFALIVVGLHLELNNLLGGGRQRPRRKRRRR